MTESHPELPALASTLRRLTRCTDPVDHVSESGLRVRDDRVLVDVECWPIDRSRGYDPSGDDDLTVVTTFGNRVEAYVAFEDLPPLARTGGVRAVCAPTEAVPQNRGESRE
jgi:hypothetical protein